MERARSRCDCDLTCRQISNAGSDLWSDGGPARRGDEWTCGIPNRTSASGPSCAAGWLACCRRCPTSPRRDDWPARREYDTDWQRQLFDAGYAGINWPTEYGGRGATLVEQLIFLEETTRAGAPYVGVNFVGTLHAGPTIMAEASAEQKAEHLPRILRGEEVWCQGFSEAGSGSDLASLSCKGRARRRRVRRDRPEDLDELRPGRRLVRAAGPHRPRGAQAQGHHLADVPDGHARHRDPPHRDHRRQLRVQRGVLRRGARAGRQPGRRSRTTAGASPWSPSASSGAPASCPTSSRPTGCCPSSWCWPAWSRARAPPPGTTRRCAARSGTCRPRWTRCGR